MLATGACPSRWWSLRSRQRSAVSPPRLRGATASTSDATRSSSPSTSRTSSSPSRRVRSYTRAARAESAGRSFGASGWWGCRIPRSETVEGTSEAMSEKTGGEVTTMPYRVARYRLMLVKDGSVPTTWDRQLRQSRDVADLMAGVVAGLDREAFFVVLLDGKNRATGINLVSLGSLTAALVHPREVFKAAIAGSAAALVLVHNHPSGDPSPSSEDLAITKRLCDVGDLVGIKVLDHIVLGHAGATRFTAHLPAALR